MSRDCNLKCAKLISIIYSLNQEFHFSEPILVVKLYNIASSLYGSKLWDLFSVNTVKLYTSWNTAICILIGLPRQPHRYFIEQIHLKTMLSSRFVSFCESMCKSRKLSIRLFYAKMTKEQNYVRIYLILQTWNIHDCKWNLCSQTWFTRIRLKIRGELNC